MYLWIFFNHAASAHFDIRITWFFIDSKNVACVKANW